jgi:hypothetical protein
MFAAPGDDENVHYRCELVVKEFECASAHGLILANVNFRPLELDWQPHVY